MSARSIRPPKQRFAGKVALVAGAGDGICRATALAFAQEGATVMLAGPESEDLGGTVKLIRDAGGEADHVVVDLTDGGSAAARAMVRAAEERFGAIDIAFNNATVTGPNRNVADICETVWAETLAANLTGVWMAMKHELAHMERNGSGVIVNTACNMATTGKLTGMGAYAASKAALSTLTRTAANEYAPKGIRINAISPGPAHEPNPAAIDPSPSPVTPLGRGASTEEVAETVVWLCSDEAAFVVGHDLVLDKRSAA
ncbi:SDR family oxidoreductase [Streptomyces sp. HNM0663]|uniref:SDR family oxidoreductase n=1 Tax=Streptomyces chengmaiensis TaxID=3040919 RepID=A0ABT6HLM8_9ACTN|nr:SDR family oxidoreductase [Streptomyces chengmaiensis]MDH2389638.1 SDR family oxidoreductase [Streptomyces chengmaiensis]